MAKRVLVMVICILGGFLIPPGILWGAVFNVGTAVELQSAMNTAQTNGEDDTIKVKMGTYYGTFYFYSTEGHSITLRGGYDSGFIDRVPNPENTILDGSSSVQVISVWNKGDIFIEGFTIRNGYTETYPGAGLWALTYEPWDITIAHNIISGNTTTQSGGGVLGYVYKSSSGSASEFSVLTIADNVIVGNTVSMGTYVTPHGGGAAARIDTSVTPGKIIISNNVIKNNYSAYKTGGLFVYNSVETGCPGPIVITGNIISDNTAESYEGGFYVGSGNPGPGGDLIVVNNTVSNNQAMCYGGLYFHLYSNTANIYNNIIWGNTGSLGQDIEFHGTGTANGYNNNYHHLVGTWTNSGGNVDVDPQYIGGGDYHLKAASACIDAGANSAPSLPTTDFDGDPRISDGDNDGSATVDIGADEYYISPRDFIGTWDGQGVFFRNSETEKWRKLASPATLIAAGDLDGEGRDDLMGTWPALAGVWVRYSSTGKWAKLAATKAKHLTSGDMNGDGREDLLATWDGSGIYYRNSVSGVWTKMAQPGKLLAAGDLDGDSKDDLIVVFSTPAGVWVKHSQTGKWIRLSSTSARDIASGDMNGDTRDDLLGSWDGKGVFYRNSISGAWVKVCSPSGEVACGDIDGDGTADLILSQPFYGGVFVKYSETGTWSKLSAAARDIAAGMMRGAAWGGSQFGHALLDMPGGAPAEGPPILSGYDDLSADGPGGWQFAAREEDNLVPRLTERALASPGPGDPGFIYIVEDSLTPQEGMNKEQPRQRRSRAVERNRR